MPKKIFAVTNIKTGPEPDKSVAAGSEVNAKALGLSKEDLKQLIDDGAIEIRTVDEEKVTDGEPTATSSDDQTEAPKEGAPSTEQ